jgi:putative transposase
MPRPPRIELAGGIFHVTARGAVKQTIFVDDRDRQTYLVTLSRVIGQMSWNCLTYCLMGTHMHLLIETPEANLSRGMHRLHGSYARVFNERHGKTGHVFGARFHPKIIESDVQLWVTIGYILRNPVKAGLCRTPEAWPWSSHAALAAGSAPPCVNVPRLYSRFESAGGDPRKRYLEFVAAEPGEPKGAWPL